MNIFLSVLSGCFLLVVLAFKKPNVKAPATSEEIQLEKSKCILRNKDVFAKIDIQKAQQFLDTYTNKKNRLL